MSITVKKVALCEQHSTADIGNFIAESHLGIVGNIEVDCLVRLGTLTLSIAELRQLRQGQTLSLQQRTHEPVDIVLNNQVIARGDLMSSDDCFAIQITEIAGS